MQTIRKIIILPIKIYKRFLSPFFSTNSCKFHPTCSQYAIEAIEKYGILKGIGLASWRILRCNPFSKGGIDYVPFFSFSIFLYL